MAITQVIKIEVESGQAQANLERFTDSQGKLTKSLNLSSLSTSDLNRVTGGYGHEVKLLAAVLGGVQKAAMGFVGSLNAIKIALISTGIGALIVALGLIVAYWDDIKTAVTGVSDEMRKQLKISGEKVSAAQDEYDSLIRNENVLRLQGKTEAEILQLRIESNKKILEAEKLHLENEKAQREAALATAKTLRGYAENIITMLSLPLSAILKGIDIVNARFGTVTDNFGDYQKLISGWIFDTDQQEDDLADFLKEAGIKIDNINNKIAGDQISLNNIYKKSDKERIALYRKELEEKQKVLEEIEIAENEYLDRLKDKQQLEEQAVSNKYFRLIELAKLHKQDVTILKQAETDALKEIEDRYEKQRLKSIKEFRDQFEEFDPIETQRKAAIAELELLKTTETEKREALAQINEYYDKLVAEASDATRKKSLAEEKILHQQKLALAGDFFGAISQLLGEQSRVGKAFAIAQALINTYQGISNVWAEKAESGLVGAGLIQRLATTAIVAAQGFAAVKNITAVKTIGGGGGGGAGGTTTTRPPSFNLIGDRGGVSDVQSGIDNGDQTPPRAYVVGGDVTTQQELDRNAVNASGF